MTTGPFASRPAAAGLRPSPARPYFGAMLAGVLTITALRLIWLAVQPADLYPDEAQYWFWAQHPAFGYYSKPPLVAWLIALTTRLFGDSEFAIRLSAPLLHAGSALFIYGIGARLYDRRVGLWSALGYTSLPGISASAFIISTDAPLLLCWSAALYAFIRARERGAAGWWLMVGVAAGLGLLAKYAMAYWMLSALGFVLLFPSERRYLGPLLAALGLAALIYLPNLWWNAAHGFVSYLHTEDNADLSRALFHPGAMVAFLGAQFAVFGPVFFAALIAIAAVPRHLVSSAARLLAAFALPTLAMMVVVSILSRAHANWAAPAYVSATVLVASWMLSRGWRGVLALSIALNLFAAAAVFGAGAAAAAGVGLPARYDPLHRLRGWRALGNAVGRALAQHPGYRLLADDREVLAALIYYVHPHPFDAVKWSVTRRIKDQWDLTNSLSNYRGGNFLLVSSHHLVGEMRPSFTAIERLGALTIPLGPSTARRYTLYLARDFKGYPPGRR